MDNTTIPTPGFAAPAFAGFTEVSAAGASYSTGGTSLGTLASMVSELAGEMKFDSAVNPSWVKDALSDVDAYWGIIYNDTEVAKRAIAYVELGGPVDMQAVDLTINWPAGGIFTIN